MPLLDWIVAPRMSASSLVMERSPRPSSGADGWWQTRRVWQLAVGGAIAIFVVLLLLRPAIRVLDARYGVWSTPGQGMSTVARVIGTVVVAPALETMLNQWAVLTFTRAFGPLKNRPAASAVVSAAIFAAGHGYSVGYLLFAFWTGLVLAAVFLLAGGRRRGVLAAWGAHELWNSATIAWVPVLTFLHLHR